MYNSRERREMAAKRELKRKEADFGAPRKKFCRFCVEKIKDIDYKDIKRWERSLNDRGKIIPRKISGTCAKHQRKLSNAVKLARYLALLPYVRG